MTEAEKVAKDSCDYLFRAGKHANARVEFDPVGYLRSQIAGAVAAEREACAAKAREFAEHYGQGSDGRNTFVLLAEWIEARSTLSK